MMKRRIGKTYQAGIPLRLDSRVLRTKGHHNVPQTKVDTGGEKSRTDRQTANLDEKPILTPLVLPAHDSTRVSQDLAEDAEQQRNSEANIAEAREDEDSGKAKERKCEEGKEYRIGDDPYPVHVIRLVISTVVRIDVDVILAVREDVSREGGICVRHFDRCNVWLGVG
jgi:hypothetical protein